MFHRRKKPQPLRLGQVGKVPKVRTYTETGLIDFFGLIYFHILSKILKFSYVDYSLLFFNSKSYYFYFYLLILEPKGVGGKRLGSNLGLIRFR